MPPAETPHQLSADDRRRICDALRDVGRDLHHRSFSVTPERRELLWQEMDQCLALADRLAMSGACSPAGGSIGPRRSPEDRRL